MADRRKERRVGEARAAYQGTPPRSEIARAAANFDWLQENYEKLEDEYAGKWIAVADKRVVGSGVRLATAMKRARAQRYMDPLMHAFPPRHLRDAYEVAPWRSI